MNIEQWYIAKFKTQFWTQLCKGGNNHRKINIQALMPLSMFEKYVRSYEGQKFGRSILHFSGPNIVSTKYKDSHCPYKFAAWFFNNSSRLSTINKNELSETVDIYNCQFQYSNNSNKLSFTCDVTWTLNGGETWQKLNDSI